MGYATLNVSKTIKEIRNSDSLFWSRREDFDLLSNGYWIIKSVFKTSTNSRILGTLVERFLTIPDEGETYTSHIANDLPTKGNFEAFDNLLEIPKSKIIDTRLEYQDKYHERGVVDLRVFKGNEYIYVNTNFVDMVYLEKDEWFGEGALCPVYTKLAGNGMFLALPMRFQEIPESLKNLKSLPPKKAIDFKNTLSKLYHK